MDSKSWAQLQRRHRGRVYGLCFRILGQAEDAEDACSEAFLRAERSRDSYDSSRPFAQWILTIASRVSIDRLRRRGLEARLFESIEKEAVGWEPMADAPSPLENILRRERTGQVQSAMAGLSSRDRSVLVMKFYADLGYEEIGQVLGLSRAHVGSLVFRAKMRLRTLLVAKEEAQREAKREARP